jgi:two-component system sensor kinase FixL
MAPALLPRRDGQSFLGRGAGYLVAIAATAACALFQLLFNQYFHDDLVFLLFVPALLASAAVGGAGPTILAGALSIGVSLAIIGFTAIDDPELVLRGGVFAALTLAIGWGGSRLLHSTRAIRNHVADLQAREADLQVREAHLQSILDTVPDA